MRRQFVGTVTPLTAPAIRSIEGASRAAVPLSQIQPDSVRSHRAGNPALSRTHVNEQNNLQGNSRGFGPGKCFHFLLGYWLDLLRAQ